MAQAGTATIKVEADTTAAERDIRKLQRLTWGRITWPEAFAYASTLGFVAYLIDKVF